MKQRIIGMLLVIVFLQLAVVPVLADDETIPQEAGSYYVYTENGKGLNVRGTPGGKIVGNLKYGTKVFVVSFADASWAVINYTYDKQGFGKGEYTAYVSRRFLTRTKPAARPAQPAARTTDLLSDINQEYLSAKKVEPYKVSLRPTRTSGWVNMRWAPSKSSPLLATYKANDQLLVLQETDQWLQVKDPDTGDVGFVNKVFVAK